MAHMNEDLLPPVNAHKLPYAAFGQAFPAFLTAHISPQGIVLTASTIETEIIDEGDKSSEMIEREYQVCVPYFEVVRDDRGGEVPVTRQKIETRVRSVYPRSHWASHPVAISTNIDPKRCRFSTVDGQDADFTYVEPALKTPTPVFVLREDESLHPWFASIARMDAIVIHTNQLLPGQEIVG